MGYGGAITGIMASLVIAFILQIAFPAVTSGSNREIIEGAVGIFAVSYDDFDWNLASQQVLSQKMEYLYGVTNGNSD